MEGKQIFEQLIARQLIEAEINDNLPFAIHYLKEQGERVWVARNPDGEITGITIN